MVPRQKSRNSQKAKLQRPRSVGDSYAQKRSSVVLEATNYIQELKQKIKDLVEDNNSCSRSFTEEDQVTVSAEEERILVRIVSKENYPNLLVTILRVFEDLGLDVLDARVSCVESFLLEAVGREMEGRDKKIDLEMVKEAMFQAIKNCGEGE